MRIKAHFLYILIVFYATVLFVYFFFGDTGVFMIDQKVVELGNIEKSMSDLKAEISQMEKNVERLKTDREYVISSAKSYGYLEGSNEKVVRILNNGVHTSENNNKSIMSDNKNSFLKNAHDKNTPPHNTKKIGGFLPILFLTLGSIIIYLVIKYQINNKKRARA